MQYSPALSSTEAEYVALAEVTKEIKFIYQILISMGICVPLPIIVRIDNNGAIFMSNNLAISERTKHIDIKYNFVRQYVEEGFIKVIFVRSEDNTAETFTKNLSSKLHQKHKNELVMEKEYQKLWQKEKYTWLKFTSEYELTNKKKEKNKRKSQENRKKIERKTKEK